MARISVSYTAVGSTTPEIWREAEDTTLAEFLEGAGVKASKVDVLHNGIPVSGDLADYVLEDGDSVQLTAKNFASGC